MWQFASPRIVFGEGALATLAELQGRRALVVTDSVLVGLGVADRVSHLLAKAGIDAATWDGVEPEPTPATARAGAAAALEYRPDWIFGLGGGSSLDAAKAIWVGYERPDLDPAAINPLVDLGLRRKARLATVPTTSGTGSEVTWAIVLTDPVEKRKLGLGNREVTPDLAVVDPELAVTMPPRLTADTGLDALSHAVEAYTCAWHNDFADGLGLQAVRLIFKYLPRAVEDGADAEARERMANAATLAGLALGNAMASLAHALGHPLGAVTGMPHGRAVGLLLPYTIEFAANASPARFADLAAAVGCGDIAGTNGTLAFVRRLRDLMTVIGCPLSLEEAGVGRAAYLTARQKLVDDALDDTQVVTASRLPTPDDVQRIFDCAYYGRQVDF